MHSAKQEATLPKTKDEIEEAQDAWTLTARGEGYRCHACGCTPPYEERETFFETGSCLACLNQRGKDD